LGERTEADFWTEMTNRRPKVAGLSKGKSQTNNSANVVRGGKRGRRLNWKRNTIDRTSQAKKKGLRKESQGSARGSIGGTAKTA